VKRACCGFSLSSRWIAGDLSDPVSQVVIPAQAGIHYPNLDSRLRGNDRESLFHALITLIKQ
ncbi:MAG: hypothetical protein ACK50J_10780, partial [Planctomyces sp.]